MLLLLGALLGTVATNAIIYNGCTHSATLELISWSPEDANPTFLVIGNDTQVLARQSKPEYTDLCAGAYELKLQWDRRFHLISLRIQFDNNPYKYVDLVKVSNDRSIIFHIGESKSIFDLSLWVSAAIAIGLGFGYSISQCINNR